MRGSPDYPTRLCNWYFSHSNKYRDRVLLKMIWYKLKNLQWKVDDLFSWLFSAGKLEHDRGFLPVEAVATKLHGRMTHSLRTQATWHIRAGHYKEIWVFCCRKGYNLLATKQIILVTSVKIISRTGFFTRGFIVEIENSTVGVRKFEKKKQKNRALFLN